jgi:hypothetical protein
MKQQELGEPNQVDLAPPLAPRPLERGRRAPDERGRTRP